MKREHIWDQFFISWLDAEGYKVDYGINADLELIGIRFSEGMSTRR